MPVNVNALSRLRLATVLAPDEVQREAQTLVQLPQLEGYGLAANVPNWLVLEFERPDCRPEQNLTVLATKDQTDHVLLLILQARTAQLRLVLQMGHPQVQEYIKDCIQRQRLTLLLTPEHTTQLSVLTLDGEFTDNDLVLRLLRDSRGDLDSTRRTLRFAHSLAEVVAIPSLLAGVPVTDAITVVAADVHRLLDERTPQAGAPERGETLH